MRGKEMVNWKEGLWFLGALDCLIFVEVEDERKI